MAYAFEIYKDRKGEFRVRFKASNGETMFSTEGYTTKASAKAAIRSIQKNTPAAAVNDLTEASAKPAKPAKPKAAAKPKAPPAAPAAPAAT
jgi:uncharacterized protein YegP (UPF0339 family)